MRYQVVKLLFLVLLSIGQSAYAVESLSVQQIDPQAKQKAQIAFDRANIYMKQGKNKEALEYLKTSYAYEAADGTASNLGYVYEELKDYNNAVKWYKTAIEKYNDKEAMYNLALLYKNIFKDYPKAIKWCKKTFEKGNNSGANSLGLLYENKLNDIPTAIKWYKKAIVKGHIEARKNLGLLYHKQKDNLYSAVYMLGMIGHPYTKKRVLGLLRDDWKIDEPTLKKAYELQQTLVPTPYRGGVD